MVEHRIVHLHPSCNEPLDILVLQQISQDFRQEVRYREQLDRYCQWYHQTSENHRRELAAMETEINLLQGFRHCLGK